MWRLNNSSNRDINDNFKSRVAEPYKNLKVDQLQLIFEIPKSHSQLSYFSIVTRKKLQKHERMTLTKCSVQKFQAAKRFSKRFDNKSCCH